MAPKLIAVTKMARPSCISTRLAFVSLFLVGPAAHAHLNDRNVPPCFEMQNERVVPRPDTSAENWVTFSAPVFTPINKVRFKTSERLGVSAQISGKLCSPYSVFIEPRSKTGQATALIQQTSPSLVYGPGNIDRRIVHFVTFAVDPNNVRPGAEAALSSIRLTVYQYGSYKQLAVLEVPVEMVWRAADLVSTSGIPEYECANDMQLPAALPVAAKPVCSSSLPPPAGGSALDLNRDGICEWIVRDAVCDKTHGNLCYRILEEKEGDFQPIAQFYNKPTLHESAGAYAGLSSVEYGPLSNLTRYSEWQDGEYITHMYLHDCRRLP